MPGKILKRIVYYFSKNTSTTARSPPFPNKEKIMPKNNTNNSGNANKTKTSAMEYRIQSETDSDTTQITTTGLYF